MAQEDEADHILQRLHLGLALQPLLAQHAADLGDGGLVIARRAHHAAHALGMAAALLAAPLQIAGSALGEIAARQEPALHMLPARRDLQRLGGRREQPRQLLGHAPPIEQRRRRTLLLRGVRGIGGIDSGKDGGDRGHQLLRKRSSTAADA